MMLLDMETKPKVLTERYELGRLLGQGTFAKVYYARTLRTNESVAIKVIDKEKVLKAGLMEQIKREIAVMKLVRHPNVLELYEVMATKSKIYFVMEYAKGGELFSKVAKGKLEEDVAWEYFRQLLDAVDFCHSKGVYHRDIKPENLLLDDDENLKVSDFGLSAIAESKRHDGLLHTTCGSPAYVAPEIIGRRGYDGAKADIWSCGVVLFVLMAGYLPFHDSNVMEMYKKIWRGEFNCPNWFPSGVRRLLKKIFDPNPESRISIAKIRESSWFRKKLLAKYGKSETRSIYVASTDADAPDLVQKSCMAAGEMVKPPCLNAFDIISLSAGFDLSGFFVDNSQKREMRFTSRQPATVIISKLEEICNHIKFSVKKKVDGLLRLERIKDGQKGNLTIDAEIFEITPSLNLIEIKISDGDVQEYHKVLNDIIRPALRDIVWAWQGEQEQVAQMMQQELSDSLPRQPLFQLQQQEPLIMNQ